MTLTANRPFAIEEFKVTYRTVPSQRLRDYASDKYFMHYSPPANHQQSHYSDRNTIFLAGGFSPSER